MAWDFRSLPRSRLEHGRFWPTAAPGSMRLRLFAGRTASAYDMPCPGVDPYRSSPRAIGWVVLLRRGRGSKACLEPVRPGRRLAWAAQRRVSPGRELSGTAFEVLTRVIGSAETCCLTYSRLDDAVALITQACR